jgi:hypothetical protein
MRPKARGLTQYGCPPGWLDEIDPTGCDFVRDGRSMLPALTDGNVLINRGLLLTHTKHMAMPIPQSSVPSHGIDVSKNNFHSRIDFSQGIDSVESMPGDPLKFLIHILDFPFNFSFLDV